MGITQMRQCNCFQFSSGIRLGKIKGMVVSSHGTAAGTPLEQGMAAVVTC